jgi:hypothetical protein
MKIAVIAISALLSACAIEQVPAQMASKTPAEDFATSVWRRLNTGLSLFYGLNIKSAVTMLGYPTSERMAVGDHVYTWESVTEVPGFNVGDPPFHVYCRIEIGTNAEGTITTVHHEGNPGGCAAYANALTPH